MKSVKQEKRPSSDSFVDVHIFVVPHELWMEKYRTTYNNSTLESISAGFVRVAPALSLGDLRNQMKEQLGCGDVIPEDFVFLRCVGRCLAIVSKIQEISLKVRHFVPPVVSSPEIFVLFGTHESLSHSLTSSLNTSLNPEYVRGYITYSREMDEGSRCYSGSTAGELSPGNNDINCTLSMIEGRDEGRPEERHKGTKEGKYVGMEEGREDGRQDKRQEGGQEGRQVLQDDGPSQRHVHFKKDSEETSGSGLKNVTEDVIQNKGNTVRNDKQLKRKDIVQNHGEMTETYLTKLPETSLEQQSNKDNSRIKETLLQGSQNTTTCTLNGNGNLLEFPTEKNAIPSSSQQQAATKPATQDKQRFDDDGDYVNQSTKIQGKNPLVHSKTAPALFHYLFNETNHEKDKDNLDETETGKTKTMENETSVVEREGNKENDVRNNLGEEEDGEIGMKSNHYSNETRSSTAKSTSAGLESNKDLSERTANNHHKETDLSLNMANKKNLILQLQTELQAVRNERSTSEKTREQLLKKAKNLQNQNNQKRTQARNIWKKRYFEEKKTTVSLEERCNQLRYEVEVLHKRLLSSMDTKDHDPKYEFVHHDGDPDTVNNTILLSRKENEVQELKRRVEEAEIKLGSEMKLRDTAQKELKHVRDEVIDKKINATLVKKSLSLLETRPSNI